MEATAQTKQYSERDQWGSQAPGLGGKGWLVAQEAGAELLSRSFQVHTSGWSGDRLLADAPQAWDLPTASQYSARTAMGLRASSWLWGLEFTAQEG